MNKRTVLIASAVLAGVAFAAGYRSLRVAQPVTVQAAANAKFLYYVDPMNPSFRSPEPGTAPVWDGVGTGLRRR